MTDTHIYCANAGDSRAVLCRGGSAVEMSYDHKPQNDEETKGIEAEGHHVEDDRVDGNLALSRAIGDFQYKDSSTLPPDKQAVSCYPDVKKIERDSADEFLIIACDGIWDCKTNESCVDFLKPKIPKDPSESFCKPVEELLDDCCAEDTDNGIGTDNMTAILIKFKK